MKAVSELRIEPPAVNSRLASVLKWTEDNRGSILAARHTKAGPQRERRRQYSRRHREESPDYAIASNLRNVLRYGLLRAVDADSASIEGLTSMSLLFLRVYFECLFEPGMDWSNHGQWEIDHVNPCCSFNMLDPDAVKRCFHWSNLRPLWALDNRQKIAADTKHHRDRIAEWAPAMKAFD